MSNQLRTPKDLAMSVGRSPLRIRKLLRQLYPDAAPGSGSRWHLSDDQIQAVLNYYASSDQTPYGSRKTANSDRGQVDVEWDIPVGRTVNRRRDHGGQQYPIRYGGAWYGGIEPSAQSANVLIFTEPEAGKRYGYAFDGWAPGGTLHYTGEGKRGDQRLVGGNRAIALHREQGRKLRVFRARPPVATYLGEFEVHRDQPYLWADAPDEDGNVRQVIVFRLRGVGAISEGDLPPAPNIGPLGISDLTAEGATPIAADVPPEGNFAAAYFVEPTQDPIEHQRREAALVDRYKVWLNNAGHAYARKRIRIPGEAGALFTDLHDQTLDELIEAKASAARISVRVGLGQLLDYARFVPHKRKALLLPSRPRPDLGLLLGEHTCGCIWEAELGRFERVDPSRG